MTLYDLNSIALTVLVFDVCIFFALLLAFIELPTRQQQALKIWMFGLAFCISSTALSVFNNWVPLQVRGALPHALLCLGLWLYWHAIQNYFSRASPPIWLALIIALLCFLIAISRNQIQALIMISASAMFLHFAAGLASLRAGDRGGGWSKLGAHWAVAIGFILVALVMLYRIGFWWFNDGQVGPLGLHRAVMRILAGLTNVVCSVGFALMLISQLARELAQQADTDALTRLLNRRAALRLIGQQHHASTASAVLLLDVDHFKSINDRYGHDIGDQALIAIAQALRDGISAPGLVARYGGEEFLIWLPDTEEYFARKTAEDLRLRCQSSLHLDAGLVLDITVSIGVAHLESGNIYEAIKAADHALLDAKRGGRNRVT